MTETLTACLHIGFADGSKDDQKAALGSFLKVNTGVNTFMGKGQISKFDDLAEKLMKGDKDAVAEAEKLLEDKEVVADDEDKSNAECGAAALIAENSSGVCRCCLIPR